MASNSFGNIFRITTWGESHGLGIGVVIDGCPAGLNISEEDIQKDLDRRRPGQSAVTTSRAESDSIVIMSGVFEGKTTGAPISLVIHNKDQDSSKYDNLKQVFRPGHADITYQKKYGLRDHRGGGRSSGRETAMRVAAGVIAKKILALHGVKIIGHAKEIAGIRAETFNPDVIEKNVVRAADTDAAKKMEAAILEAKAETDSVGGIVEVVVEGCPPGLGDPIYEKIDARLANAALSIGATKGVEFGDGFAATKLRGSENNDIISEKGFISNHSGGILGGITTGDTIVLRIAVKPASSIAKKQDTITKDGKATEISVEGRHDPCIVPRVVPVAEAMVALVLVDALLQQRTVQL